MPFDDFGLYLKDSLMINLKLPKMMFILGRGRSGTTLLTSMLNSNEDICVAPECLFAMNLAGRYGKKIFNHRMIDRFCHDIFLEKRIKNWSFNQRQLSDFLKNYLATGSTFDEAVRLVYSAQAHFSGKHTAVILGDKNPHYSLFANILSGFFPDAYWIHIVRDPRATVVSYKPVKFDYSHTGILAGRWREYNEHILNSNLGRRGKYLFVRFEDLLRDPDQIMGDILQFLDIKDAHKRSVSMSVSDSIKSRPWHQKLRGNLVQSPIDEWKLQLAAEDVALTEKMCGRLMNQFHYHCETVTDRRSYPLRIELYSCLAKVTVLLEKWLFTFPIRVRSLIITIYRRLSSGV